MGSECSLSFHSPQTRLVFHGCSTKEGVTTPGSIENSLYIYREILSYSLGVESLIFFFHSNKYVLILHYFAYVRIPNTNIEWVCTHTLINILILWHDSIRHMHPCHLKSAIIFKWGGTTSRPQVRWFVIPKWVLNAACHFILLRPV
jgi:hypothetical protein